MEKFNGTLLEWLMRFEDDATLDDIDTTAYDDLDQSLYKYFYGLSPHTLVSAAIEKLKEDRLADKHPVVKSYLDPFAQRRPGDRATCHICGAVLEWHWFENGETDWSKVGWKAVNICE